MSEIEKKPHEIWKDTQDKVLADIFAAFDGYTLYECQNFCALATKKIEHAIKLSASQTPFDVAIFQFRGLDGIRYTKNA